MKLAWSCLVRVRRGIAVLGARASRPLRLLTFSTGGTPVLPGQIVLLLRSGRPAGWWYFSASGRDRKKRAGRKGRPATAGWLIWRCVVLRAEILPAETTFH